MPFKKLKSLGKKVLKPVGKAVKKIVPKELAGIMQAAAPFVAASNPIAALALTTAGQYKQRGRISPLQTALSLAPSPQVRGFTRGETGLFGLDSLKLTGKGAEIGQGLDTFLYGAPSGAGAGSFRAAQDVGTGLGSPTQGLIGKGGEFGLKEFTKGSLLSPDGKLSKARVAGLVAAGASLATAQQQIEEEAVEAGITSESTLDDLKAEAAEIFKDFDTTAFRPQVTAAIGGLMRKNLSEGSKGKMASDPTIMSTLNDLSMDIFGKPYFDLTEREQLMLQEFAESGKPGAASGGLMRTNYALGSRPTAQESGLGGLPIEADMRYTGGFMPYGAREKADDVPARLSKNEFVFTADAVRAAGGGNINKGARRMYNTMKQLESMGRA